MSLNCQSNCVWKNPLLRDGTSQADRFLQALSPDFAKIDERDTAEFLRFAYDYATKFKFYNLDNTDSGQDWQKFFKNDAVATALVIREDLAGAKRSFAAAKDLFLNATNPNRKSRYTDVLRESLNLCVTLESWLELTEFSEVFRKDLDRVIKSQVAEMLKLHLEYDLGANTALNALAGTITGVVYDTAFPRLWAVATTPPDVFGLGSAVANTGVYIGGTQQLQMESAVNYVEAAFDGLIAAFERLKTVSRITLDMFLERWPDHEPHFALFLTFIQLFSFAQDHLNSLTERHLNIFYKDILQLEERKAIPDQVHVIFQLASNLSQHLVPAGTGLDAAKDATGKNLQYDSNHEIVVNKAEVSSLKTVFLGSYNTLNGADSDYDAVMFDAPVANSIDGLGAPLDEDEARWKPFGDVRRSIDLDQDGTIDHTSMRISRHGFAVSSPVLIMQEGIREVELTLSLDENTLMPPTTGSIWDTLEKYWSDGFEFRITGENGWMEPEIRLATNINTLQDPVKAIITLQFTRSQDPVVKWNEKIHGRTYNSPWPVLEITLNHLFSPSSAAAFPIPYDDLERINIIEAEIKVNVEGVTNLVIQNDQGNLDPSKPFPPFTQTPSRNANFYIGNTEVFSKKLDSLTVDIGWLDVPASDLSKYYEGYGTWNRTTGYGDDYADYDFNPLIPKEKPNRLPNTSGDVDNINGDFKGRLKLLNNYRWENLLNVPSLTTCQYEVVQHYANIAAGRANEIRVTHAESEIENPVIPESGIKNTTSTYDESETIRVEGGVQATQGHSYQATEYADPFGGYTAVHACVANGAFASGNNFFLFDEDDAREPIRIKAYKSTTGTPATNDSKVTKFEDIYDHCGFDKLGTEYKRDPYMPEVTAYNANSRRGFLKIQLADDFLHSVFPQVTAQAVMVTSKIVNYSSYHGEIQPPPNPPFTPMIKDISLSYESSIRFNYTVGQTAHEAYIDYDSRVERLYHILPFGEKEIFPADGSKKVPKTIDTTFSLFPGFGAETTGSGSTEKIVDKGFLYVGLKNLNPAQNLSLLFQFAEGTEDPAVPIPVVKWSFLSNNQWKSFQPLQIIRDTTNGMANSGIVTLSVPSSATNNNTSMPAGLHWIRIEAPSDLSAFSDLIAVHAQAVASTFLDQENDPDHLYQPLPGEVIKKFLQANGSIKKVSQPYPSFGGRVKEEGDEFYLRVSETLRHKHRAITIWDYEHQILEEFPDIYKVKCINHTDDNSELAPGSVKVVLIPKVENYLAVKNPFELKVGTRTLAAVGRFLDELRNPFVNLEVQNPRYEKVKTAFEVKFHQGRDADYYTSKLITDIQRYLSPWAYGQIETIRFGGKVHKSLIINYIEELEYVDFLKDFVLYQYDLCTDSYITVDAAVASTAASILVTAPTHDINAL